MAEYKSIKGTQIQVSAGDLTNPKIGQIWYNKTTQVLRGRVIAPAAWSTGEDMTQARRSFGYAGTQTAALAAAGGYPAFATTEEYDGTNWSSANNMSASLFDLTAAGLQTAAAVWGGDTTATYEYDGTNWTTGGSLGIAVRTAAGFGLQTAAVSCGGISTGNPYTNATEEYNGTSWADSNNMNTTRSRLMGMGTLTAGLAAGGVNDSGSHASTEEYDGTSWANSNGLNTARRESGSSSGVQTSAVVFAGITPSATVAITEVYDGTCFSNDASMSSARAYLRGCGSTTAGLAFGGNNAADTPQSLTEEYTGAAAGTVTIDPV
jgi:hypothetical protein